MKKEKERKKEKGWLRERGEEQERHWCFWGCVERKRLGGRGVTHPNVSSLEHDKNAVDSDHLWQITLLLLFNNECLL